MHINGGKTSTEWKSLSDNSAASGQAEGNRNRRKDVETLEELEEIVQINQKLLRFILTSVMNSKQESKQCLC